MRHKFEPTCYYAYNAILVQAHHQHPQHRSSSPASSPKSTPAFLLQHLHQHLRQHSYQHQCQHHQHYRTEFNIKKCYIHHAVKKQPFSPDNITSLYQLMLNSMYYVNISSQVGREKFKFYAWRCQESFIQQDTLRFGRTLLLQVSAGIRITLS